MDKKPKWDGGVCISYSILRYILKLDQFININTKTKIRLSATSDVSRHRNIISSRGYLHPGPISPGRAMSPTVLSSFLGKAGEALCIKPLFLLMVLCESPRSDIRAYPLCLQDTKHLGEKATHPVGMDSCFPLPVGLTLDRYNMQTRNFPIVSWSFDISHAVASCVIPLKGQVFPNPLVLF